MNQDQRDEIVDSIPKHFKIVEADEELGGSGGTLESWGETLGHELNDEGRCLTCGRGTTCTFKAFYEAMISSVVRELDKLGRLLPTGTYLVDKNRPQVSEEDSCTCNSREVDQDGRLVHYESCPEIELRSAFERDHEEDMQDPEYRQAFERTSEDLRGPVTWCMHDADRHDGESGCIECRCIWRTGH